MRASVVLAAALAAAWLVGPASRVGAQSIERSAAPSSPKKGEVQPAVIGARVPCARVMSRINEEVGLQHGRAPDMSLVARHLGTTPLWVERCMLAYGRRPKRPGGETSEAREERLEALEESEPEEVAPEDVQEPGARERVVHPERERAFHIKPPPTPADFEGYKGAH